MRKQLLATTWALLAVVVMAGAQTPGTEAASHAALQKIGVTRGNGGISIEMTAKGAVTPTVETLSSPARIVVDLPNTVMATSQSRIHVGSDGVSGVRVGTDAGKTTRVVVDLDRLCKYELVPGPGEKLTLKLETAAAFESASTPAKVDAPVQTATVRATPAKTETAKNEASNFLFVEPTFTPKKDVPQIAPPARTVAAASKFVERPEGNLLPGASAAIAQQDQAAAATPVPVPVPAQSSAPAAAQSSPAPAIPTPVSSQPAVNMAAEQRAHPQSPISNPKYTGEPISVNLKDVDLKDFFRLIHEISGLNVVLDPDVHGTLTIVLDDVPWDQALDIVLKNNTLSRQLDGNVLRIATMDTLRTRGGWTPRPAGSRIDGG